MNPAFIGVLVLLLIVAGVTIVFLMMKPKNVQATASRAPTPVAEPAPARKTGSGKGVSASGSGSGKPTPKPEPKAENVSTKKANIILTTKYAKEGCEGQTVSKIMLKPGIKLGATINQSLPEGRYACCAQIENMKIDKLDATLGKKKTINYKDADVQNKMVLNLTHNEKIPGGSKTVCAEKFDGTFRISQ